MKNAQVQAWLDQEDAHTAEMIRRHGLFINCVGSCSRIGSGQDGAEGPSFAHTVGLYGIHHPELLIVGASLDVVGGVLNTLGRRIRAGEALLPGALITFERWPHRIIAEQVPNPGQVVLAANRYYDRPKARSVPVLQLSYDDMSGRFPWEPGYVTPELQPRPGTFRA